MMIHCFTMMNIITRLKSKLVKFIDFIALQTARLSLMSAFLASGQTRLQLRDWLSETHLKRDNCVIFPRHFLWQREYSKRFAYSYIFQRYRTSKTQKKIRYKHNRPSKSRNQSMQHEPHGYCGR